MDSTMIKIETAAEAWLANLKVRRRRPIKPASAKTFRSYLDAHILPRLGQLEVGSVGVAVLRKFIDELNSAGLSAKSQVELVILKASRCIPANGTTSGWTSRLSIRLSSARQ
jgi:hypothetical protein